jgi:hypothetical protein
MSKKDEQIITEYNEVDATNLIVDEVDDTKDENFNEEIKEFIDGGASVRVTVSEAKPFGDQPYASDHL